MEKSNTYIFVYSVALVVIIATLLSVAAFSLKPAQQANVKIEKMQNILAAVKIEADVNESEALFKEHVKSLFFVKEGTSQTLTPVEAGQTDTFNLDLNTENLPLFELENEGETYFVIPLQGDGLWGPIWGYVSILKSDCNTIKGAVFDHSGETAGLGAEIVKPKFRDKFEGKQIFDGDVFTSVKVIKGGAKEGDVHGVDAISGSTKTCDGVTKMLKNCIEGYSTYFQSLK